ncbi:MAG: thioredoxin domain-containing protein, partial [candidate division WOR-3 bacterium]
MKNLLSLLTVFVMASTIVVVYCGPKQPQAPSRPAVSEQTTKEETQVSTRLPKLWDFWATWCPPCKELKPTI